MSRIRKFFFISITFISFYLSSSSEVKADDVIVYVTDNVYIDYLKFVNNRDVLKINHFNGTGARRDVIDMVIIQQALALGGFEHNFIFLPNNKNFRSLELIIKGESLLSFDSFWLDDATTYNQDVYISKAVINKGEYIAGIYTSPKSKNVLNIKKLNDLKQFTAVSTPLWKTDWQTLSALPLKKLIREDDWLTMANMVSSRQVDLFLMPFHHGDNGRFTLRNIDLVPVKNIAIELHDSRHFIISKKHVLGYQAYHAINKGLALLRKQHTITRAYREAGFFIDKSQYNILNLNSY